MKAENVQKKHFFYFETPFNRLLPSYHIYTGTTQEWWLALLCLLKWWMTLPCPAHIVIQFFMSETKPTQFLAEALCLCHAVVVSTACLRQLHINVKKALLDIQSYTVS